MLRKMVPQVAFVCSDRIGNFTLANDAATSSTQGEVGLSTLFGMRIADVQIFTPERIKSNQGFFTTSNTFVERRRALLLPANLFFCTVVVFPPYTFRFKLAEDAFVLKHSVQKLALLDAASFLQRGVLHFLIALALGLAAFVMLDPNWLRKVYVCQYVCMSVCLSANHHHACACMYVRMSVYWGGADDADDDVE